jgi:hypothetical protein
LGFSPGLYRITSKRCCRQLREVLCLLGQQYCVSFMRSVSLEQPGLRELRSMGLLGERLQVYVQGVQGEKQSVLLK